MKRLKRVSGQALLFGVLDRPSERSGDTHAVLRYFRARIFCIAEVFKKALKVLCYWWLLNSYYYLFFKEKKRWHWVQ